MSQIIFPIPLIPPPPIQAFDVSDIYNPTEVSFYEYEISEENAVMATYDAIFGPGGYIYASDSVDGVRVLNFTGVGKSGKIKE